MKNKVRTFRHARAVLLGAFLLSLTALVVYAQQITGVLGAPSATTTIEGNQIPAPPPKFGGVIKENAKDSKTWWPPRVVPPKGNTNTYEGKYPVSDPLR